MFNKIAEFCMVGALGFMLVVVGSILMGVIGFGIYSAFIASSFWTGMGVLLFIFCGVTGQMLISRTIEK